MLLVVALKQKQKPSEGWGDDSESPSNAPGIVLEPLLIWFKNPIKRKKGRKESWSDSTVERELALQIADPVPSLAPHMVFPSTIRSDL